MRAGKGLAPTQQTTNKQGPPNCAAMALIAISAWFSAPDQTNTMKRQYILKSTEEILNGTKVEITGKDQSEIDRRKAEVESLPVLVRLIPENVKRMHGPESPP